MKQHTFWPHVEALESRNLPATFVATTAADVAGVGSGSLRQAILDANAAAGADVIQFKIGAVGSAQTIAVNSSGLGDLPIITDSILLDGWSQGGFGYSGTPLVTLSGSSGGRNAGLQLVGDNITVRGLAICDFSAAMGGGYGILVQGAAADHNSWIYGNVITGNGQLGIWISGPSHGNRVGTNGDGVNDAAEANVLSGNGFGGVNAGGLGNNVGLRIDSNRNAVAGNFIGVRADGTIIGNKDQGIWIAGANNLIGGSAPGMGNVISGNLVTGLQMHTAKANGNFVVGNFIGTNAAGADLGNLADGIRISGGASDNRIEANVVAFNLAQGINVFSTGTLNNRITANSIHSNARLGIDIFGNDATPNDAGDGDAGPNLSQNFPVLTSAASPNGTTIIAGTLNSTASTTFRVEFFSSPAPDALGHGEGQTYLGSANVTTDGSGNVSFKVSLSVAVPTHQWVSATATDPAGNTSEFALSIKENDTPLPRDDFYSTNEDTRLHVPAAVGVLANDTDADGDALGILTSIPPSHAAAFQLNADGSFSYTPAVNYFGTDSFSYTVVEAGGSPVIVGATVYLTVNSVNDPPTAAADSYTLNQVPFLAVTAAAGVLANDTDVENDALTVSLLNGPAHGNTTLNNDGSFTYLPTTGYSGTDSFSYRLSDGNGGIDVGSVSCTVIAPPLPPVAPVPANDLYTTGEDIPLSVPAAVGVLANDGSGVTVLAHALPAHAAAFQLNADGSFSYTPAANYFGADSFTYSIIDAGGNPSLTSATVYLTVNPVNDPPIARADSYVLNQVASLTVTAAAGVQANDTDVDGDPLTASLLTGPAHGNLTLNGDGSFTYTPTSGFSGTDSFSYRVSDGHGGIDVAGVILNVIAPPVPPPAVPDPPAVPLVQIPEAPAAALALPPGIYAIGGGRGALPAVRVIDAPTGADRFAFYAFSVEFTGGVRVAIGDVTGDGASDIIAAAGPGGGPQVAVFDGRSGALVRSFFAMPPGFTGGVFVAAGDVNGDGFADIICSADAGGGPQVSVFDGRSGAMMLSFFAFAPSFTGGVRLAAGDVNGDGRADIIAAAGPGALSQVTVFRGHDAAILQSFFAFGAFAGGVYVAAADLNGDGRAEIVAGAGAGGGPQVAVFASSTGELLDSFFALDTTHRGGVQVAALARGRGERSILVVGPGEGPAPIQAAARPVRLLDALTHAELDSFFAFGASYRGGVSVGA